MSRPRVLFISRKWPPAIGGMESYSKTLAASLGEHCDVELLVLPGHPSGRPPGMVSYAAFLLKAMARTLFRARNYNHLILGDVVLFPAGLIAAVVAPQSSRTVILYGLDLVYQKRAGALPWLYGLFLRAFVSRQTRFTHIVAISAHTRTLANQAGIRQVSVIVPAIPDSELVRSPPRMDLLPAAFRAAPRRALYFGRLVPRKGADWFASRILPHLPGDVTLFVVGSPTDRCYSERLVKRDRVEYLGRQPDQVLAALISSADVVVMPNISSPSEVDAEGFGLVAVEASALGAILVASRLQGITDAVVDGQTGILVDPEDEAAWIETVSALLKESEERKFVRRRLASSKSREAYSVEQLGLAFLNLLESDAIPMKHSATGRCE